VAYGPGTFEPPHTLDREQGIGLGRDGYFGGTRLLVTDARVAFLLLNEARFRAIERMFGAPRDQSALVTAVAVGTLMQAVHSKATQIIKRPAGPSVQDTVIGAGIMKAAAHGIAGDSARDSPQFGTLVAIAVLGAACRPLVRLSWRDVRAVTHRMRRDFDHRYGHLVRPNRRPSR
jgi:hypothetical protein